MKINVILNLGNRQKRIGVNNNLDIDKRKDDKVSEWLNWNEDVEREKKTKEQYLYWIDYEYRERPDPQTCIIAHTAIEAIQMLASEQWTYNSGRDLVINYIQKFSLKKPKIIFYGNIMPSIHIEELAAFNKEIVEIKNTFKDIKELKEKKTGRKVFLMETKDSVFLVSADSEKEARKFAKGQGRIINIKSKLFSKGIVLHYDYEDLYFD